MENCEHSKQNFWHNGFNKTSLEEKKAWAEHAATDEYLTVEEMRKIARKHLPNVKLQRLLFWRYCLIWQK